MKARRDCRKCVPSKRKKLQIQVVVSPTGLAHIGLEKRYTACGHDASGGGWTWR